MKKSILFVFLVIPLLMLVSASIEYKGNTITDSYSSGEIIKGAFNASFKDISPNANITSNFKGSISLLDLLKANGFSSPKHYNCTTQNCLSGNQPLNSITAIILPANESKTIGFKITGKDIELQTLSLALSTNALASCFRQISLDLLSKKENLIYSNKYTNITCFNKNYGCFNSSLSSQNYQLTTITTTPYCENITLQVAPAYKLGAKITNGTSSTDIKLGIYTQDLSLLKECTLPKQSLVEEELECIVNQSSLEQNSYYICIKSSANADFKIKSETVAKICGTNERDYEIFARPLQFAAPGAILVNQSAFQLATGLNLKSYVSDYIDENYDNQCDPYCVVPLTINPLGITQEITLSSPFISYKDRGAILEDSSIYSLAPASPLINTTLLNISINPANFIIPESTTQTKFRLFLDSDEIFQKTILISTTAEFDVNPKSALVAQDTFFVASLKGNITSYSWNFGDGTSAVQTTANKTTHRYLKEGEFNLVIQVAKADKTTQNKTFKIIVGDPKTSSDLIIKKYESRIINITKQINTLPSWLLKEIEKQVDVLALNSSLSSLKKKYSDATTPDDYTKVMTELIKLDVPYSISVSKSGTLPINVGFENINTALVKEISGASEEEDSALDKRIMAWTSNHYTARINFQTISSFADSGVSPVLTKFKIELTPSGDSEGDYLFISYPSSSLIVSTAYSMRSLGTGTSAGTAFPLSSGIKTIEFALPEALEVADLGAYISPEVSALSLVELELEACNFNLACESSKGETADNCPSDCKSKALPWIWVIIILVIMLIVYIILQEWYKNKYEKHLFKNPNDLYNIITFIQNSRKSGQKDEDIRAKLKKASWSNEQINYAFRKLDGKRTGMFEIPIFKFREKRKLKEELAKRQAQQKPPIQQPAINFIKRQNL